MMAMGGRHQTWAPTEGHHRFYSPNCNILIATQDKCDKCALVNAGGHHEEQQCLCGKECLRVSASGEKDSRQYISCVLRPSA